MILAAGLSPAWQQMLCISELAVGQVNRATEACWSSSGKVLNVALALHHLGADVSTLAVTGGLEGQRIEAEFDALGIPRQWIGSAHRTRVCTTILDLASGETTELVENAHPISEKEMESFEAAFVAAAAVAKFVILSGSLPRGVSPDLYARLVSLSSGRAILDIRGPELLATLEHRPFLVKPNREELAHTAGRSLEGRDDVVAAMAELNEQGAEWVLVTDGPGEVLVHSRDALFGFRSLPVQVLNPIACGDCFCAALAWALARGKTMEEAVPLGIAAAAENATKLLPGRLDPKRVERLAAGVERTR